VCRPHGGRAEGAVPQSLKAIWGGASAWLDRTRRAGWADLLVLTGLGAAIYGMVDLAQ
jgi:hypothetical protein